MKTKLERVRDFLSPSDGAGIIYTGTRRDAEEVAEFVREVVRQDAQHYHAGLEAHTRSALQEAFLSGDLPLIVATNAFGMGIDRPDVRFVLHYSLPGSLEAYSQEAGRAGRDGLPAQAILIYSPKDTSMHEKFIENDSPTAYDLRAIHEFLKQHPATTLDAIERAMGVSQVRTRVAVEQLEQAGAVRREADEDYGVMRVQARFLSGETLRAIAAQNAARRRHKLALLQRRVAYAETNGCRRRAILNYFGDHGPADAPLGSDKPVLKLTPRGEHALRTRAAVQVSLRPPDLAVLQKTQAVRVAGGTIELTAAMVARGCSPEQIAIERELTVGTIYSHLAQLIAAGRIHVNAVVSVDLQSQIRAAIEQVGSAQYLAPIKAFLPEEVEYNIIRCVANAWRRERGDQYPPSTSAASELQIRNGPERGARVHQLRVSGLDDNIPDLNVARSPAPTLSPPADPVAAFLLRPRPRSLAGAWCAGWALDFRSRFDGDNQHRGLIGELVYRFKYRDERTLASDLAAHWAELLAQHPELPHPDVVIPIPPSTPREFDPVAALACALAAELKIAAVLGVLGKTRVTKPQKEMTALAQKKANVMGAFILKGDVRGKNIVLVDDLFDSGATMSEAARVLARGGVAAIVVLTLTKTIHADA